jgi:hypothetical protein
MAAFQEDRDGEVEEKGLEDMQPEVGLIKWVEGVSNLVGQLRFHVRCSLLIVVVE